MGASVRGTVALAAVVISLTAAVPVQAATTWRTVPTGPLKPSNALVDVSATGPADAWAIGYQNDVYGSITPHPYSVLRWNGSAWSQRDLPDDRVALSGISAASPSDVWTVGQDEAQSPYAAHWNGTAWQTYRPLGTGGAVGVKDVDARGGRALLAGGDSHALLAEWNGTGFAEVPVPVPRRGEAS